MKPSFDNEPLLIEARGYVDRALGGLNSLHLGPLDYNVATTVDVLRAAALAIEAFGQEHVRKAASRVEG